MSAEVLTPRLELLKQEYVLVQAWKKTASYIRHHNWFSDTLELDRTAINLPQFLAALAAQLNTPSEWLNDPLRIIPAPKSQRWRVASDTERWAPVEAGKTSAKLRPLAHVSLKDQVTATALMLCLANRVETIQGDPRTTIDDPDSRRKVISYGNRLLCDVSDGELRHRWGSGKLYRGYYQDYQTFLTRPEIAAETLDDGNSRVVIVHSDLRHFYDRVRPELIIQKIDALRRSDDDPEFYALALRLLNWEWDKKDAREVEGYAKRADIPDFARVALPQGLVAAGFFANITLLEFDQGLRGSLCDEIETGIRLVDVSRYVDDLRLVLAINPDKGLPEIEEITANWLQQLLNRYANGLQVAKDKTRVAAFRGDERPLIRQSRKMVRIQGAISGGFDAVGGAEILDAVQGLIRSQQRYSEQRVRDEIRPFLPVPDVRDPTVARFAAGRFRTTYRSLRPLLVDDRDTPVADDGTAWNNSGRSRVDRTQAELDDEARAFALGLIENWVEDPSNVRLLRIGLDLWPADDLLKKILTLLRPFTEKGGPRKAPRRVAWYCLSEIFRAGATETGFVGDNESFPGGLYISAYRRVLREEAVRLSSLSPKSIPWYLKQQVLLFLAATDPIAAPILRVGRNPETRLYRELIRFLTGGGNGLRGTDFVTLAILCRRSFLGTEPAVHLVSTETTTRRLEQIAERDPSFALEILNSVPGLADAMSPRLRDDLCLNRSISSDGWVPLSQVVLDHGPEGPLRNELELLRFASKFLTQWTPVQESEAITPCDVLVLLKHQPDTDGTAFNHEIKLIPSGVMPAGSIYLPPQWCVGAERWRFQLGYLLRFILSAREDFTKVVHPYRWKERTDTYRESVSHWYQRRYGFFNGQSGFGDDWLPITDWTEQLLFALLSWPGCHSSDAVGWVRDGIETVRAKIEERLQELKEKWGRRRNVLMLPLSAPSLAPTSTPRPLRACVVQTVIPTKEHFKANDLTLSDITIRKRHRNHLSAALAAIDRMLYLRETHKGREGRLDWLILPELSVHPLDVQTHLVPFARAHKTIILVGLTYQALRPGQLLVNSALWIIPTRSTAGGLQMVTRRQGKQYLAPDEQTLNASGNVLRGFRPCQWLIGYEWSGNIHDRPLWLTASICYDATDLGLASDLREQSDVFAIPALNQDVNTFDQMALALHYHMFQMVIVANNGLYGGSNAYVPYKEPYLKQVFHLHGQPQASMAFLEIDDIRAFLERKINGTVPSPQTSGKQPSEGTWKYPPAGP